MKLQFGHLPSVPKEATTLRRGHPDRRRGGSRQRAGECMQRPSRRDVLVSSPFHVLRAYDRVRAVVTVAAAGRGYTPPQRADLEVDPGHGHGCHALLGGVWEGSGGGGGLYLNNDKIGAYKTYCMRGTELLPKGASHVLSTMPGCARLCTAGCGANQLCQVDHRITLPLYDD